ncbi:type II secretion system protein [Bacillus sp. Marseille-P3661]|uniref:type II secretion system protein n=1 Tax=Bacillus sp. Marseille-P3661 TaxID=1936234 RepID=UPI000C817611|nr:type II secretion system protein [Bacillus sp. Marseille-P3661]
MLVNCKGFSLVEVLVSFALFLMVTSFIVPIFMNVSQERYFLDYKRDALLLLHNEKETYLYDKKVLQAKDLLSGNKQFHFTAERKGNLVELCIFWEAFLSEQGQTCTFVKP